MIAVAMFFFVLWFFWWMVANDMAERMLLMMMARWGAARTGRSNLLRYNYPELAIGSILEYTNEGLSSNMGR